MAKKGSAENDVRVVARNRKATHDFEILARVECGVVLRGTEVKSLRMGKAAMEGAFARLENGEIWLYRLDIPEYAQGGWTNHDPQRKRKLLLHRREIAKLAAEVAQKGSTLTPLQLYFKGSRVKLELALARGKKMYDKRQTLKEKDAKKAISRATGTRRGRG